MPPVTVLVLAPQLSADAGPLERRLDDARAALAEHHRRAFLAAGADAVVVRREPPDDTPFGARLRRLVEELEPAGLVVMGAGSIPLATAADLRAFLAAAATEGPGALANHRYSADIIAIARAAEALRDLPPDLASDNALPRWLAEMAGVPVRDLRARRRLAMDVDSPLDLLLLEGRRDAPVLPHPEEAEAGLVRDRLAALRRLAADPAAEPLVAGPTSAAALRWFERSTRAAPIAGRPGVSWASCSTVTGLRASADTWPGCVTARSSTAVCCWPIAVGATSVAGRPPRTASRATSSSPGASATRGWPT